MASAKLIQGWACLYGDKYKHWYWKNERFEVFEKGAFAGSLWGVWLGRDHKYTERRIATQDDGSLEILDTEIGLAFRAKLNLGDLEWIDGRSEVSVSYVSKETESRDGIHRIKSAAILEISLCHVATLRAGHAIVCDANSVGTLADDVRDNFASNGASVKFMDALRRLDTE
jgi:hypothetical protein